MEKRYFRKFVVLAVSVSLVFVGFKFFSVYFLKKALGARDNAEKLHYLSKAVSLQNDEARLVRAMTYIEMNQSSAALKDLFYVSKTHPGYPVTFMYLGNVYYDMGQYQPSLDAYAAAQKLLPRYIERELLANKSADKLSNTYGLTARQVADNLAVKLYLDRAGTLVALRRFADALVDVEKARELAPLDPYVYLSRSGIYDKIGNRKLAAQDYNQAFILKKQLEESAEKARRQIEQRLKQSPPPGRTGRVSPPAVK
ncbi:MAG: hypothetical protein PHW69_09645 [Elusimicrobiaceae bacterium]|nr:hypothetical protein [Elusimicrobiaceae bacterium]